MQREYDVKDGSKLYVMRSSNMSKHLESLYAVTKWCYLNPGKKAVLVSTLGRLEMSFTPDPAVQKNVPATGR